MKSFTFWQRWLFYSSLVFALFGLTFGVFGANPLFAPYNEALARVFFNQASFPPDAEQFRSFIWAPLGGTIACCYILLAFIAYYPFKQKETWARNAIIIAYGIWIILDSSFCIYYHIYFQFYIINTFSFLQKALPIIFTWKEFSSKFKKEISLP